MNKKRGRPALFERRKPSKSSLKVCIDIPTMKPSKRKIEETHLIPDQPAPLQRQNAFLVPPPPPPPPPSPTELKPAAATFEAVKQEQLPFALSVNQMKFGLSQISLWLCGYCMEASSERICIRHSEQIFLSLRLCKKCMECNTSMQAAANGIWKKYWDEKLKAAFVLKQKHEKENEEAEKKKRLEAYGLTDMN
jgi:hypothetical protein